MRAVGERGLVRAIWLLALLVLPPAVAQGGPLPGTGLTVTLMPWQDPIRPLMAPVGAVAHVRIDCDATSAGQTLALRYAITRAPPWANVGVSPASDQVDGTACAQMGGVDRTVMLFASTSDHAPAFAPDPVELTATLDESLHGTILAKAAAPLAADYFSLLDVSSPETTRALPPGGITIFPVKVVNFGNANTKVAFAVESPGTTLVAVTPPSLALQSRQAGGAQTGALVPFEVHRSADAPRGLAETVTLRWRASYALDSKLVGDSGAMSFVLTDGAEVSADPPSRSALDTARQVPGASVALVAMALVGVALVARRRRKA